MKQLIAVVSLALAGFALSAQAADAAASAPAKAHSAQNNKMKTCSADFKATGRPSSERKAFMKECLSAKKADPTKKADTKKADTAAAPASGAAARKAQG